MPDRTKIPIEFNPQIKRMVGRTIQGDWHFDVPFITKVAHNLWQGGCTDGLILPTNINYLVSLYPWERYEIRHKVRGELYFRMHDDPEQDTSEVDELAKMVNRWREKGTVLVHCQAGLNRSSLVVARALMYCGMSAEEAIQKLRENRSPAVLCNKGFESYLKGIDTAVTV